MSNGATYYAHCRKLKEGTFPICSSRMTAQLGYENKNMNTKNIEEMTGFREPTEKELKLLKQYFSAYHKKRIRTCNMTSVVFGVIGVAFFSSFQRLGGSGMIVGTLFFLLVARMIIEKKKYQKAEKVYRNGGFQVLEGNISEFSVDTTTSNQDSVKFVSKCGQQFDHLLGVHTRDLRVGTELLLVCVNPSETGDKRIHAFTPDMLTEDGIRHTL